MYSIIAVLLFLFYLFIYFLFISSLFTVVLFWILPSSLFADIILPEVQSILLISSPSRVWSEPILIKEGRLKMGFKCDPIVSLFFKLAG